MRENIGLFRAKRIDNGEWVDGDLVRKYDKDTSEPSYYIVCCRVNGLSIPCYFEAVECVIPETIGQFTGLYDKNGKKIFEGDIVRVDFGYRTEKLLVCFGEFEADSSGGEYGGILVMGWYLKDEENSTVSLYCFDFSKTKIEVIGNIYDNKLGE